MRGFRSPLSIFFFLIFLCSAAACDGKADFPAQSASPETGDFSWLTITFPAGWQETSPGHFEGRDGYAWLELLGSSGAGPGAVCMGEANRRKPQAYGAVPEIRDLEMGGQPACLILPSGDQPADRREEALYLLWVPEAIAPDTLLALHADRGHILAISESMGLSHPLPIPSPFDCDFSAAGSAPETTRAGELKIDAFPIARGENCSPEHEPEQFYRRILSGPPAERAGELRMKQYQGERLERLNARLLPFAFRVEAYAEGDQYLFRVLRQGKVVRSELSWVGQISLSQNGQVFFLPVVDSYDGRSYLVRPDGVHTQEGVRLLAIDLVFPVYAGSDRISLAYEYERIPRVTGSPALLQILKNDQVIDTFSVSGANPASGPARGLWSWQNHWYLELPGLVLRDGEMLNDRLGYPEMFTWRLLNDRPFYFYRKEGLVHAVYNDRPLTNSYDEVLYEPQWDKRVLVQMRTYESGLVFFARRGDTWYYVVIEAE